MSDSISRRRFVAGAFFLFPMHACANVPSSTRSQALARSLANIGGGRDEVRLPERGESRWRRTVSTSLDPAGEGMWWFSDNEGQLWRIAENPLRPEHLGAKGGDEHPILQQWANLLGNGVDGQLDRHHTLGAKITIEDRSNFKIGGTGRLSMASSTPVEAGYSPIAFVRCTDFELSGITVDGNRQKRRPKEVMAHNIQFQACHRFRVNGVSSINAVCDGFYIASPTPENIASHCSDFIFQACLAQNCYRQGMSIIQGHQGKIISCTFSNTNGTAPQAGVDLESSRSNPEGSIEAITFERCQFVENRGFGLQVSYMKNPNNINIQSCVFRGNDSGPIAWGARSGTIANCHFVGDVGGNIITTIGAKGDAHFRLVRPIIS